MTADRDVVNRIVQHELRHLIGALNVQMVNIVGNKNLDERTRLEIIRSLMLVQGGITVEMHKLKGGLVK